jgi:hypothetical protein
LPCPRAGACPRTPTTATPRWRRPCAPPPAAQAGARRDALKDEIGTLAKQRSAYVEREVAARGGAEALRDAQVYRTVREQAGTAGPRYAPASAPAS